MGEEEKVEFEDIKGIIKFHNSEDKKTNNDRQKPIQKTKDLTKRTPL